MRSPKMWDRVVTWVRSFQPRRANILATCRCAKLTFMQGIKMESPGTIKSQLTTMRTPSGPISSSLRTPIFHLGYIKITAVKL